MVYKMFLTTRGRYAVMAMVELANHKGQTMPLRTISEIQEIDLSYLEQIFSYLKKAGLVRAVKGPGGGYMLTQPAESILMVDIISAVNENTKITRCTHDMQDGCMKKGSKCATHHLWAAMENNIKQFMTKWSLADICSGAIKTMAKEVA
ncbi:MAG: Rrf2 family transcriptional regulator [Proteobacteria bacterium]|nr:Rrf2 family transcriptional regulator [Pseudomonadota bacterium]